MELFYPGKNKGGKWHEGSIPFCFAAGKTRQDHLVTSRLDYRNSVLDRVAGLDLERVQNSLARVVTRSRPPAHASSLLQSLHWLPIKFRIDFKLTDTINV